MDPRDLNLTCDEDGGYTQVDGTWHESLGELLQVGLLNFCACGDPETNLYYIMRGLELLAGRFLIPGNEWDRWRRMESEHFKSREAAAFFYYWLDSEDLTEHGSVLPGWLSPTGEQLLSNLREWFQKWRWTNVAEAIKQRGMLPND